MSVKVGVYAHEAYEAKKTKNVCLLCEYMGPTSVLYIYILLVCVCMFVCVSYDAHDDVTLYDDVTLCMMM